MEVKLTAGLVVRMIDKQKIEGISDQCKARHGYVGGQWVAQAAQNNVLAQRSKVRKEKTP